MDISFDPNNYRKHSELNKQTIRKSLVKCGPGRSIVLDNDNVIIAGNGVFEQAKELGLKIRVIESTGEELIAIKRTDLATTDEKRKLLAMADNQTSDLSEFDMDALFEDFTQEDLEEWGFEKFEDGLPTLNNEQKGCLKERFIIPPFSVLDTKLGNWQERKKAWLELGIKSEIGRDIELTYGRSSQPPRVYQARNELRKKLGKDPSWDELIDYCKKNDIKLMDGTSVFDPVLCELAYRWFNIPGGKILDPFAGGSVRGIVAGKLEMPYCGIDLRKEQVEANYQNAAEVLGENASVNWVCDDSCNIDNIFPADKFDMVFSCPPYADLEEYSDDPRDLSNMEYKDFLQAYRTIIKKSCDCLNDDSFAVFVVGEVREKKGNYYNFVSDTVNAFLDAGLKYYNEMILVNNISSLAMRVSKQFNNSRKIGKHHQNVLVFYKGDLSKIKDKFPTLDFSDDELFNKIDNE